MTQIDILLSNNTQERESRRLAQSNEQADSAERYMQAQSQAQQGYEQSATASKQAPTDSSSMASSTSPSTPAQQPNKAKTEQVEAKQSATSDADGELKSAETTLPSKVSETDSESLEHSKDDFYAQLLAQLDAATELTSTSTANEVAASEQSIDTDSWPVELKHAIAALSPQQFEQFKAQFSELAKRQGMSDAQVTALGEALTQLHQGAAVSADVSKAHAELGKGEHLVVSANGQGHKHAQTGQQSAEASVKLAEQAQNLTNAKGEQTTAEVPAQMAKFTNKSEAPANAAALATQGDVKQLSAVQSVNTTAVLKSEHVNVPQSNGHSPAQVQANSEAMSQSAKLNADIKAGIELNIATDTEQSALDLTKAAAADSKELKPAQLSAALMSHLQSQGNGALSQAIQNDSSQWQQVIQQTQTSPVATERAAANMAATANAVAMLPVDISKGDAAIQLQQRVNMMLNLANQQAEIRIDPPELGSMQVRVRNEGEQAHVHFLVQNQQAKEALEQSMPRLRELLAQQGLELGESQVDDQGQHGFNQHSEQGEQGEQGLATQQASVEQEQASDAAVVKNAQQKQGIDFYA